MKKDRISLKSPEMIDPHPFVESPESTPPIGVTQFSRVYSFTEEDDEDRLQKLSEQIADGLSPPPVSQLAKPEAKGARAVLESCSEMLPAGIPKDRFKSIPILLDGHTPKENLVDKDTNPKDVIAASKLPLSLVPDTMVIYATLAFLEGALKYGRYNWRVAGVRSSIYLDALKRHIADYENGEESDPKTGVPHLANALACIGIILDAKEVGKLNDDRPPVAPIGELIRKMEQDVIRLKELFKSHNPHQYTIRDSPALTSCEKEEETLP